MPPDNYIIRITPNKLKKQGRGYGYKQKSEQSVVSNVCL